MWAGGGSVSGTLISARPCRSLPEGAEREPVLLLLQPLVLKLQLSPGERRGPPSHGREPGPAFGPQQESTSRSSEVSEQG